jgi:hypothetical protein
MIAGQSGMTKAQVEVEIRHLREAGKKVTASRETAIAFLQKHGFITQKGKLTAKYSRK